MELWIKKELKLQCASLFSHRSVLQGDFSTPSEKCPHCGKDTSESAAANESSDDPLNLTEIALSMQKCFKDNFRPVQWFNDFRPYLTIGNAVGVGKFLLVLLMAAANGLATLLPKILTLLNRTIHESAFLIRQITPFLLACVDVVNKAIGGFYLLITMMWKDLRRPKPPEESPKGNYLEGPNFPYRREVTQRPYLQQRRPYQS